jgi:hypothetical protein
MSNPAPKAQSRSVPSRQWTISGEALKPFVVAADAMVGDPIIFTTTASYG